MTAAHQSTATNGSRVLGNTMGGGFWNFYTLRLGAKKMERHFDFNDNKLIDLGVHADVFVADASVRGGASWLLTESNLRAFDQFIEQALAEGPSTKHPEWFGLTTDDKLKSIGHFETFDDADEACSFPTHWIFDEDSLRSFQVQIHSVLGTA